MTKPELQKIISNHLKWLNDEEDGVCANFSNADLNGTDFSLAADLSLANFVNAKLIGANLVGKKLIGTKLVNANLIDTNLNYANLRDANLKDANLNGANLVGANLVNANLKGVELIGANLSWANLSGADLKDANISLANLEGANLSGAKNIPFIPNVCPGFGAFIGYKKAAGYIVELEILADAKRCSGTTRTCRCDKARVLSIQNKDGTKADINEVASDYNNAFIYKVGETVEVKNFDDNRWNDYTTGIYFFINRQEALEN